MAQARHFHGLGYPFIRGCAYGLRIPRISMPTKVTLHYNCLSRCADYLKPVTATELEQELWSPQSTIV
jgi:hypothetical protein